jgi:hypothetical protein
VFFGFALRLAHAYHLYGAELIVALFLPNVVMRLAGRVPSTLLIDWDTVKDHHAELEDRLPSGVRGRPAGHSDDRRP